MPASLLDFESFGVAISLLKFFPVEAFEDQAVEPDLDREGDSFSVDSFQDTSILGPTLESDIEEDRVPGVVLLLHLAEVGVMLSI